MRRNIFKGTIGELKQIAREQADMIDREDLVEFIEDHIVTKPVGKLIRILPFEWDDFLKEQEGKKQ